jgi:uncharacterized cofD-like protein
MNKFLKWLYPGIKVKRWFVLFILGLFIFIIGMGLIVNWRLLYLLSLTEQNVVRFVYLTTGRFLPLRLSGALIAALGFAVACYGFRRTFGSLISALIPEDEEGLADILVQKRQLERGPKIVVVGGGTGLSNLLRGIKRYSSNITAIVTVTDDGGSSGKLREELGILPPGDIRNCLVALADTEPLMEKLFQYRFDTRTGMAGHSFGNLFIASLSEITGDFEQAVKESSRVLAVRGRVIPSTLENAILCGENRSGEIIKGETRITASPERIVRLFLEPENCAPVPEAISALLEADMIVLGPGSLYTSIIPNLLVGGIGEAIRNSKAIKVYVCNVMTQPGETSGYSAAEHLEALNLYLGEEVVDYIIVNNQEIKEDLIKKYQEEGAQPVNIEMKRLLELGVKVIARPLIHETDFVRHDPDRLAQTIFALVVKGHIGLERRFWRGIRKYFTSRFANKA